METIGPILSSSRWSWILLWFAVTIARFGNPIESEVTLVNEKQQATPSPVIALAFDADAKRIAAGVGDAIWVFDNELNVVQKLPTQMEFVNDLKFTNGMLVAAGGSPAVEGMISTFSDEELTPASSFSVHADSVLSVAIWKGSIVAGSADNRCSRVRRSDLKRELLFKGHSKRVTSIDVLTTLGAAVSGGMDDTIRLWDLESGKLKRTLNHHQDDVLDLDIREKERNLPQLVSVSADKTVRFWQPTIGRMVRFKKLEGIPTVCVWVPDSDKVVVGTRSGQVFTIDSNNLKTKVVRDFEEPIFSICILNDGKCAVGTTGHITLIQLNP